MTIIAVMLTGAGGTGKTSVARELKTVLEVRGIKYMHIPSTTRGTYGRLGIDGETAALAMPVADQINLQNEIGKDNLAEFLTRVHQFENELELMRGENPEETMDPEEEPIGVVIVDRPPLDHLAYWIRSNALQPTDDVSAFETHRDELIRELAHSGVDYFMWIDHDYPVPWETADAFRDQNKLKTLEMSHLVSSVISRYHTRLEEVEDTSLMSMHFEPGAITGDPSERAVAIYAAIEELLDPYDEEEDDSDEDEDEENEDDEDEDFGLDDDDEEERAR
jgi:AAA domain